MGQKGTQHHIERRSLQSLWLLPRWGSTLQAESALLLPVLSCLPWEGNFERCVLTSDTRLARSELLGEVDIVESARRGRLVMRLRREAHSCSGRQYSRNGWVAIDPLERHRPRDP